MRTLALCLLALTVLGLVGCNLRSPFQRMSNTPPNGLSWHTTPGANERMRVAVLPFALAEHVGKGAAEIAPAFEGSLREIKLYEVVRVSPEAAAKLPLSDLSKNKLSIDSLTAVRDATGCDAMVVGRVEQYDGFHPVSIGLIASLVSCQDGTVLWSVQAQLNGRRDDVQRDIEAWWNQTHGDAAAAINSWRSVLETPRDFCAYTADRMAWTIVQLDQK